MIIIAYRVGKFFFYTFFHTFYTFFYTFYTFFYTFYTFFYTFTCYNNLLSSQMFLARVCLAMASLKTLKIL